MLEGHPVDEEEDGREVLDLVAPADVALQVLAGQVDLGGSDGERVGLALVAELAEPRELGLEVAAVRAPVGVHVHDDVLVLAEGLVEGARRKGHHVLLVEGTRAGHGQCQKQ